MDLEGANINYGNHQIKVFNHGILLLIKRGDMSFIEFSSIARICLFDCTIQINGREYIKGERSNIDAFMAMARTLQKKWIEYITKTSDSFYSKENDLLKEMDKKLDDLFYAPNQTGAKMAKESFDTNKGINDQ